MYENFVEINDIHRIFRLSNAKKKNNGPISFMTIETESKNFKIETSKSPPSFNIAWYDQKEIFALPTLLVIDIKDIDNRRIKSRHM
jgi:hypothetical protein